MFDFHYCAACLVTGVKMRRFSSGITSGTIVETFNKILEIPVSTYFTLFFQILYVKIEIILFPFQTPLTSGGNLQQ